MGWHVQQLMQVPAAAKKKYDASLAHDDNKVLLATAWVLSGSKLHTVPTEAPQCFFPQ